MVGWRCSTRGICLRRWVEMGVLGWFVGGWGVLGLRSVCCPGMLGVCRFGGCETVGTATQQACLAVSRVTLSTRCVVYRESGMRKG
jgi:hypothetical protein